MADVYPSGFSFQQAVTASAVTLAAQSVSAYVNVKAKSTNAGNVFVGFKASLTTADDGTGIGYRLLPGESMSWSVANTNMLYIIGTASDVVYVTGN